MARCADSRWNIILIPSYPMKIFARLPINDEFDVADTRTACIIKHYVKIIEAVFYPAGHISCGMCAE